MFRFSVSNIHVANTVFAIFAKQSCCKHSVCLITHRYQWLNFYRRSAFGNSPRPTLSIYCSAVRKYLLTLFAMLMRICLLWRSWGQILTYESCGNIPAVGQQKLTNLAYFQKRTIYRQCAQNLLPLIAMQIVHIGIADLSVVPTLKSTISPSTPTKTDEQSTV